MTGAELVALLEGERRAAGTDDERTRAARLWRLSEVFPEAPAGALRAYVLGELALIIDGSGLRLVRPVDT